MIGLVDLPAAQAAGAHQAADLLLLALGVLPHDQQRRPLELPQLGAHQSFELGKLLLEPGFDGRRAFPGGGLVHLKLRVVGEQGGRGGRVARVERRSEAPERDAPRVAREEQQRLGRQIAAGGAGCRTQLVVRDRAPAPSSRRRAKSCAQVVHFSERMSHSSMFSPMVLPVTVLQVTVSAPMRLSSPRMVWMPPARCTSCTW